MSAFLFFQPGLDAQRHVGAQLIDPPQHRAELLEVRGQSIGVVLGVSGGPRLLAMRRLRGAAQCCGTPQHQALHAASENQAPAKGSNQSVDLARVIRASHG